jgi:hypothetical protein
MLPFFVSRQLRVIKGGVKLAIGLHKALIGDTVQLLSVCIKQNFEVPLHFGEQRYLKLFKNRDKIRERNFPGFGRVRLAAAVEKGVFVGRECGD